MNVTSVSSASALLQTTAISSTSDGGGPTEVAGGESAGVSRMADLMSQLQSLSETDPDQFEEVMTSLSRQLQEAAEASEGGEAGFLAEMADRLQAAAESGDVASLRPPEPPPAGSGPPPQKARAAYEANGQQPSVDLAQLIRNALAQCASSSAAAS